MGASYIDIKGDGIFALFDNNRCYSALCAAVTSKTFVNEYLKPKVYSKRSINIECHIGIDSGSLVFKKIGLEPRNSDDSNRRNEVWAGTCVNISAKLASFAKANEVYASPRFYNKLVKDEALYCCECSENKKHLWNRIKENSLSAKMKSSTKLNHIFVLKENWCKYHGSNYCERLLNYDN